MNELSEYVRALRRILPITLPLAIVGLVAGAGYSLSQPKAWEATTTLYVHRVSPVIPNVYDYDGYYAQQAAQQYTDTVVGLLTTPDIATRAASIASESSQSSAILSGVKVKKIASQLVSVSVDRSTSEEAQKDLVALAQAVSERSASLNDQYGRTYKVEMVIGQPIVDQVSSNLPLNSLIGLVGGAVAGLFLSLVVEYLRR